MAWTIEFDERAVKEVARLDQAVQRQVLRYLRERIGTAEDPRRFGKPLRGELAGVWRYRVGDHRLLCRIEDEVLIVLVVAVGHRREVYGR